VELGLIIIYKLQGCFSIGESNFSDHGANRLGASALMQGLADGYFVLPTIGYLSPDIKWDLYLLILQSLRRQKGVKEQIEKFMNNNGTHSFPQETRKIMWDKVGMARNAEGLNQAIVEIAAYVKSFTKT
jgi:succinate dehydrogenase / fumarate reductase flavoprotein subunit